MDFNTFTIAYFNTIKVDFCAETCFRFCDNLSEKTTPKGTRFEPVYDLAEQHAPGCGNNNNNNNNNSSNNNNNNK